MLGAYFTFTLGGPALSWRTLAAAPQGAALAFGELLARA